MKDASLTEIFQRRCRIRDLDRQLLSDLEFHGIVGRSPALFDMFDLARKIARHYTNVLLMGQTGTGKELVAHAIHQMSPVAAQRFVVCNCSAMVDTLLESQLFGHVRGLLPAPPILGPVFLNLRTAAPYSSMKWARHRSPCRPRCCG